MTKTLRASSLSTIGLGNVIDIFKNKRPAADAGALVEQVFGPDDRRGAMVISGAQGIVGSGKTMQLGARLEAFGVPIVALDLPAAPDGIGRQYPGLVRAFGRERADRIMKNVIQLSYDGTSLPADLDRLRPCFLLEAIPEVLELKRAHYELFRSRFHEIEIRSVTSGFPSSELGVGIAHPAFPHEVNKLYEVVEPETSAVTRLLWALGLIPVPVSDHWSFVLDVLFCGLTLAAIRYQDARNMPFWKIDKYVRKKLGPNPFRAHDVIGAKGANFLTWSCLHHLGERYGELFRPTPTLEERKETGQTWYPPDHFRPVVDWALDGPGEEELQTRVLGALFQMTSLMLHEDRARLAHINIIGELCAQFRRGVLALMRERGPGEVIRTVEAYHRLHPEAAASTWFPDAVEDMDGPEWQQLYVNAEHDGSVGVITLGREAYNSDVDRELNRALDWLRADGIERVIVTGDFHLSTQMIGADTAEFFPALEDAEVGRRIAVDWSTTARRLSAGFRRSVGVVNGKRCLGGMLELLLHCHVVVAVEDAALGFPEVALPVVPGMEGCHWPFRKARAEDRVKLLELLLSGRPVSGKQAVGWLVDAAGRIEEALSVAWAVASGDDNELTLRKVEEGPLKEIPADVPGLAEGSDTERAARSAIVASVRESCAAPVSDALAIQARHSAAFMASDACRSGRVGAEFSRVMKV